MALAGAVVRRLSHAPARLIAAAGLSGNANPAEAYRTRIFSNIGAWIADVRNAAGDPYIPLWTEPLRHGAFYTDRAGNRIHDEKFNYYGVGTYYDLPRLPPRRAEHRRPARRGQRPVVRRAGLRAANHPAVAMGHLRP